METMKFARLLGALAVVAILFTAPDAFARNVAVFLVNYGSERAVSEAGRVAADEAGRAGVVAIVDSSDASLVFFKEAERGQEHRLRDMVRQAIAGRRSPGGQSKSVNLAASLDLLSDILRAKGEPGDAVDFYVIDSMLHKDKRYDFSLGYPNDGFLFLGDNDFHHIQRITASAIRLHILNTEPPSFAPEYQRFFTHLAQTLFEATLESFNDRMTLGLKSQLDLRPIDRSVAKSQVIREEKRPACEYEDELRYTELTNLLVEFTLRNPCRKNTIASYFLNGAGATAAADDNGVSRFNVQLVGGRNVIELLRLDNTRSAIFTKEAAIRDDAVQVRVADNLAELNGDNPLRQTGEEVTITHVESGRKWTVRADGSRWKLKAPVSPGQHHFAVTRPGGQGEPQVVVVDNGSNCSDEVSHTVRQGTAEIVVTNPCRANKMVTFSYLDQRFVAQFDGSGRANVKISLLKKVNDVFFDAHDGSQRRVELAAPDLDDIIKVTLLWDAPVDIDLHVFEPGASFNSTGHIYFGNLNNNADKGIGTLDMDARGSGAGVQSENYVVKASAVHIKGVLSVKIDFFSRKDAPQPPYCGSERLASIPVRLIVADRGNLRSENITISSVPCGTPLTMEQRYRRVTNIPLH